MVLLKPFRDIFGPFSININSFIPDKSTYHSYGKNKSSKRLLDIIIKKKGWKR